MSKENHSNSPQDDTMEALYCAFKSSIINPSRDKTLWTEDELIDIFDFAGDQLDDFVRMEVLLYWAQHYPESELLASRKLLFYFDNGNDDGVETMLANAEESTPLNRIIAFKNDGASDLNELNKIISESGAFGDEEVKHLLDIVLEEKFQLWLEKNYQRIVDKCVNPDFFFINGFSLALEDQNFPLALKFGEELTLLDSFNIDYWEMYASAQIAAEEFEEALVTLEYSLALNPESVKSKLMKATALAKVDPSDDTSVKLFTSLLHTPEFEELRCSAALAVLLIRRNDKEHLKELLYDWCAQDTPNIDMIEMLLTFDQENAKNNLRFLKSRELPNSPTFWFERARHHLLLSNFETAAHLLWEGFRRRPFINGLNLFMEVLYAAGRYDDVAVVYNKMEKQARVIPDCVVIYALSLLRVKKFQKARAVVMQALNRLLKRNFDYTVKVTPIERMAMESRPVFEDGAEVSMLSTSIFALGYGQTLNSIIQYLDDPEHISLDDIDPLAEYLNE